jgi:hypothetical protein
LTCRDEALIMLATERNAGLEKALTAYSVQCRLYAVMT